MKLKTLKDLEDNCYKCDECKSYHGEWHETKEDIVICWMDELRQEAIKWIKDIQSKIFILENRAEKGLKVNRLEIWENIGKSNVLMDFFNIEQKERSSK